MPLETRMKPEDAGWQAPRRSRRPQGPPDPLAWLLHNRLAGLPEEVVEDDSAYSQEYPKLPSQPQKTPVVSKTTQMRPAVRTQVVSLPETNRSRSTQPYRSSYFLPGKILGRAAPFLLDTGCTTYLLSRRLFDTLGARERASLEPYKGAHGTLADKSRIPFYGVVMLPGRVHDQVIHEMLIVSQLKEDAILGMPFLEKHQCRIDFKKSVVVMAGRELACVDKFGRPLVGRVQVVGDCMVPRRSHATLRCRVNCRGITSLGVVERTHRALRLTNSLNRLDCWKELLVQGINSVHETRPTSQCAGIAYSLPASGLCRRRSHTSSQHGVLSSKRTWQESLANEPPGSRAMHVYTGISVMHGLFATGTLSHTDMAESA